MKKEQNPLRSRELSKLFYVKLDFAKYFFPVLDGKKKQKQGFKEAQELVKGLKESQFVNLIKRICQYRGEMLT